MRTKEEVEHAFTYHAPRGPGEIAFYQSVREQAGDLALFVFLALPETPERTLALRKIQDAVMAANLACALHGLKGE